MIFSLLLLNLVGLGTVACADNELHARNGHTHEQRAYPQVPLMSPQITITTPHRALEWGDFNVIHTTDTHGWLLGHQKSSAPEPNYSGNLGEFASFVAHMKQKAIDNDADLLIIDSGDLHDGTGLSEGFPDGDVDGHDLTKILRRIPYDLMTIGNHDLNDYDKTFDMYTNFIPDLNGYYLSSNANLKVFKKSNADGDGVSVPVGKRYAKFRTRKGRLVTSLGVLFNWKGNARDFTSTQSVDEMMEEPWFVEAITEEPDVFVLIGHMPVSASDKDNKWSAVTGKIREKYSHTPILIFGGHSHIRDCQTYPYEEKTRAIALQSGRYMETVGWMSAKLGAAKGNTDDIEFTRRYLDQNRATYMFHTSKTSDSDFDTPEGLSITNDLRELETRFKLTEVYGTVPQDYTMFRHEYPDPHNVFRLFVAEAAPYALSIGNERAGTPNIIIVNNGLLRYDVLKGDFTKNDEFTVSPYAGKFKYIEDVPACLATKVFANIDKTRVSKPCPPKLELRGRGHAESRYHAWLQDMYKRQAGQTTDSYEDTTPGYVTTDNCGAKNDGDDTKHSPLVTYELPHYMNFDHPGVPTAEKIDLVFNDYIQDRILMALNSLPDTRECPNKTPYKCEDMKQYTETTTTQVLPLYVKDKWPKKE